jgi:predicted dehydrogenase
LIKWAIESIREISVASNNLLKVGIVGLGNMGRNHVRILSILKNVEIEFIHDIDPETAGALAGQYGLKVSTDLDQDIKGVDALVLVSPTSLHYEHIKRFSGSVQNIFVEKPLTSQLETSQELQQLAADKGINIQVGYIERFNPAVVELKKLLDQSSRVVNVEFTRTNKLSSRITDVDVVTDLMIHDIDLALHMNGAVREIYAYGICDDASMIGYATAVLTHENGRFSRLTASRITEKRIRQINATCEDMYVDCNLLKKEISISKQTVEQAYKDVALVSIDQTIDVSKQEALLTEDMAFVASALSGDFSSSSAAMAKEDIEAMMVAQEVQQQIWRKNETTR